MKTRRGLIRYFLIGVIFSLVSLPYAKNAMAQTYSTWENPDQPSSQAIDDARLKEVLDRLNALIDQAEKDRAADPKFLQDLRDLATGYDRPWTNQVLYDDFADGDYTQNPAWTIGQGRYWIEKNWGLRNGLDEVKQSSSTSKDAAAQIFGQILNQALGGSGSSSTQSGIQPTSIFASAAISNAFSIEVDLSSWVNEGELVIGPYQGSDRVAGYRLSYTVGKGLALRIKSRSGSRTIALEPGPFTLEDKKVHKILWTRTADGTMRVDLDGKNILDVRDVSFRDPFIGFGMATRGGDFIIKQVSIHGMP